MSCAFRALYCTWYKVAPKELRNGRLHVQYYVRSTTTVRATMYCGMVSATAASALIGGLAMPGIYIDPNAYASSRHIEDRSLVGGFGAPQSRGPTAPSCWPLEPSRPPSLGFATVLPMSTEEPPNFPPGLINLDLSCSLTLPAQARCRFFLQQLLSTAFRSVAHCQTRFSSTCLNFPAHHLVCHPSGATDTPERPCSGGTSLGSQQRRESVKSDNVQITQPSDRASRHGRLARLHARPVRLRERRLHIALSVADHLQGFLR